MPVAQLMAGKIAVPAASTTTVTSPDLQNTGCRGVTVYIKTTAIGTGSVTITINGKDEASGDYYLLLSGAAVITNTTNRYTVYPGVPVVANVTASDVLPRVFQIKATANNANPADYTVGFCTLA